MELAVITGASSGIGAATARRLAAGGRKVVLVARSRSPLEELAGEIGDRAVVEVCDAGEGDAVLEMAERVRRIHGVPDLIVNCAGAGRWEWIEDTSPTEAAEMMRAPYLAAYNVTRAFIRGMLDRRSGIVIHVNSPAAFVTWPSTTGYAASRWALRGFHEALSDDLWRTGVQSCHLVFGRVSSAYFDHNPGTAEKLPLLGKTMRAVTPQKCAEVIEDLARRPRRQVFFPFQLRLYYWSFLLLPWFTHWLMRSTGSTRPPRET